jgi:dephospho-CoA kinase
MATTSRAASSASERGRFSVGLTGGIGSGKSLVARLLAEHGAAIIDTDALAHRLTAAGGGAIEPIRDAFGPTVIDANGALDRARMRTLVFSEPVAKNRLEQILHPLIRGEAEREAERLSASSPYLVFAVPLLVESGTWAERVDRVLVVDCPVAQQIERVVRTRALTRTQVESIIAQQAPRARRLAAAHDLVVNAGPAAQIAPRVARLHGLYCRMAARAPVIS